MGIRLVNSEEKMANTKTMSDPVLETFKMERSIRDRFQRMARIAGVKRAALLKTWVLEWLRMTEGATDATSKA